MTKTELISLVKQAQSGDKDAFNALFAEYYGDIYYLAKTVTKDSEIAADVTQETFLEIINTINNLNKPESFLSWIKTIAYHQCSRYYKKKEVKHEILPDSSDDGTDIFESEENDTEFIPDAALEQEEFGNAIINMINDLPDVQRAAVMMRYYDEFSVKEIAEIQGVPENTVTSRLNYARKSIKKSVEDYEKKHDIKLHSVSVAPLLMWLFSMVAKQSAPKQITESTANIFDTVLEKANSGSSSAKATPSVETAKTNSFSQNGATPKAPPMKKASVPPINKTNVPPTLKSNTANTTSTNGKSGGFISDLYGKFTKLPLVAKIISGVVAAATIATAVAVPVSLIKKNNGENSQVVVDSGDSDSIGIFNNIQREPFKIYAYTDEACTTPIENMQHTNQNVTFYLEKDREVEHYYRIDSQTEYTEYKKPFTITEEGEHNIEVNYVKRDGTGYSDYFTVTIDRTAPIISGVYPSDEKHDEDNSILNDRVYIGSEQVYNEQDYDKLSKTVSDYFVVDHAGVDRKYRTIDKDFVLSTLNNDGWTSSNSFFYTIDIEEDYHNIYKAELYRDGNLIASSYLDNNHPDYSYENLAFSGGRDRYDYDDSKIRLINFEDGCYEAKVVIYDYAGNSAEYVFDIKHSSTPATLEKTEEIKKNNNSYELILNVSDQIGNQNATGYIVESVFKNQNRVGQVEYFKSDIMGAFPIINRYDLNETITFNKSGSYVVKSLTASGMTGDRTDYHLFTDREPYQIVKSTYDESNKQLTGYIQGINNVKITEAYYISGNEKIYLEIDTENNRVNLNFKDGVPCVYVTNSNGFKQEYWYDRSMGSNL